MSNSNPLIYYTGGGGAHNPFDGGETVGLMGLGQSELFRASMKMYNSSVVDGNWIYALTVTNNTSTQVDNADPFGPGFGTKINALELQSSPYAANYWAWSYTDATKSFLNFGSNHASGALRAFTLGEDGRLYYYGYNMTGATPDWAAGTILVGVLTAGTSNPRLSDFTVAVTGYNPSAENAYTTLPLHTQLAPQIATRSHYLVVFQPQQIGQWSRATVSQGHIFGFDTATQTFAWRKDFPANYFTTNTQISDGFLSSEQAVQMTIAGDSAYIVEPFAVSGTLRLRVERFALADGAQTTTLLDPLDQAGQPIAVTASQVVMREVAAVDGTLTCLIDTGLLSQALVVIEGGAGVQPLPAAPRNLRIVE